MTAANRATKAVHGLAVKSSAGPVRSLFSRTAKTSGNAAHLTPSPLLELRLLGEPAGSGQIGGGHDILQCYAASASSRISAREPAGEVGQVPQLRAPGVVAVDS
jgi:hypothetical protein